MISTVSVDIAHHVYSSLGGYRTLHRSPTLSDSLVRTLEEAALRIYRTAQRGEDRRCIVHFDDGSVAVMHVALVGSDDAGRPRCCVHSVMVHPQDLGTLPLGINFFVLPGELFISSSDDLMDMRDQLPSRLTVPTVEPVNACRAAVDAAAVSRRVTIRKALVALLAAPHWRVVARGPVAPIGRLLRILTWLLPPENRANLSIASLSEPSLLDGVSGLQPPRLEVVPPTTPLEPAARAGRIAVDLSDRLSQSLNMPEPIGFVKLVERTIFDGGDRQDLELLVSLLYQWPAAQPRSLDQLDAFVLGSGRAQPWLDAHGNPTLGNDADPALAPELARAIIAFWHAGSETLAKALVRLLPQWASRFPMPLSGRLIASSRHILSTGPLPAAAARQLAAMLQRSGESPAARREVP